MEDETTLEIVRALEEQVERINEMEQDMRNKKTDILQKIANRTTSIPPGCILRTEILHDLLAYFDNSKKLKMKKLNGTLTTCKMLKRSSHTVEFLVQDDLVNSQSDLKNLESLFEEIHRTLRILRVYAEFAPTQEDLRSVTGKTESDGNESDEFFEHFVNEFEACDDAPDMPSIPTGPMLKRMVRTPLGWQPREF